MEHDKPSIKPIAYNYGLYSALLTISGLVVLNVLNLEQNWILSVISTIITIFIFYHGINTYKKRNGNYLTIKEGLKTGMGIALIGGILSGLYAVVHYTFIQTGFLEAKREEAIDQMMSQNPSLEGEALEMGMNMINITTSEFFIATMMILGNLFFGFILSLIISAILKK